MARFFTICFSLLAAFSTVATPVKRTVAQVEADIAQISSELTGLSNAFVNFPLIGGTMTQASALQSQGMALINTINTGTTDANNTPPPSESDSLAVLTSVGNLVPIITTGLQAFIVKKASIEAAVPIMGAILVSQLLATLDTAVAAFETALIDKAPDDLKPQAQDIADTINAAIVAAQSA